MKIRNLSVRDKNIKKGAKLTSLILAILVAGGLATGCTKQMDCEVQLPGNQDHAHVYMTEDGFMTERNSENETIGNSHWTAQYVPATDEINEMGKFGLFKIAENSNELLEQMEGHIPYTEYEYKSSSLMMVGKVPVTTTRKRWSTDNEHSRLTGEMRDVSYQYYGYRIGTDKKGERILIQSELVDDIFTIANEYPYFKPADYYTNAYSDTYTKEQGKPLIK